MNDLYNPCGLLLEWLTFADKDARNRFVLFSTDFAVERSLAPKHIEKKNTHLSRYDNICAYTELNIPHFGEFIERHSEVCTLA
ncbi:unnamed protein product [Brugia pahangi]|uniref:Site-specific DNA-methyltransferase (adenine-specific) n=1 Tax=Brugia pahangi TaxID=6280 RepID=A0A0N4T131_BRUPA|nr:unnamed protein product [Brugia pahangi]